MSHRIFYSEYLKEKFLREIRRTGRSIVAVERDFVGVWTVFFREG